MHSNKGTYLKYFRLKQLIWMLRLALATHGLVRILAGVEKASDD